MRQHVHDQVEWANELGRLAIAFGQIEHVAVLCHKSLPRDPIYQATAHLNLSPRIALVLAVLSASEDKDSKELAKTFQKAKKLAEERNLAFHNPLMTEILASPSGDLLLQQSIQSIKIAGKSMTFDQLAKVRTKAEHLATLLYSKAAPVLAQAHEREKKK